MENLELNKLTESIKLEILKELQFQLPLEDIDIIINFLRLREQISHNNYINYKSAILNFFNYTKKDLKTIQELDGYKFLIYLDTRNSFRKNHNHEKLSLNMKKSQRYYLKNFFSYYKSQLFSKGINYINPIPEKATYSFSIRQEDIKNPLDNQNIDIFSDEELIFILNESKKQNFKYFILYLLLICCGMRIREALSIEIRNIDLEQRVLTTGFQKGARKSTLKTKTGLTFFFPEKIIPYLELYIKNKNRFWLFPSTSKGNHISEPRGYIRKRFGSEYARFHKFRRTLITRLDEQEGMQTHIREILMNHTPSTTQGKAYIKKSIDIKRKNYDKFFPFYHVLEQL